MTKPVSIDSSLCPLCGQQNACSNQKCGDSDTTCWCNSANISFDAKLIDQVPESHKNKACICQQCAQSFNDSFEVK